MKMYVFLVTLGNAIKVLENIGVGVGDIYNITIFFFKQDHNPWSYHVWFLRLFCKSLINKDQSISKIKPYKVKENQTLISLNFITLFYICYSKKEQRVVGQMQYMLQMIIFSATVRVDTT